PSGCLVGRRSVESRGGGCVGAGGRSRAPRSDALNEMAVNPPQSGVGEPGSDEEIVRRVCAGEEALFEVLMRRHNQRVYRAARAILRNDVEAEDVMQDAYVRANEHLRNFEGRSRFSTW